VAVLFAILFFATTIVHIYQCLRHRQKFCLVIITGALWETGAFALRVLSARHPTQKVSYDASFLLALLAPVCINAFDYMIVSRVVRTFLMGMKVFGVKGSWMGKIFVCCDVM
jgi:RTA1 like protein